MSARLSQTRPPLLASWVSVSMGTAIRSPKSALNNGRSSTPPKPAIAATTANPNAATEAARRGSRVSAVTGQGCQ